MRNILEEALKGDHNKLNQGTGKTNLVCIHAISTPETCTPIYNLKSNPEWKFVSVSTA